MKRTTLFLCICAMLVIGLAGCPVPDPTPTFTETTLLTANGTVPTATFTGAASGSYVVLTITNDSGADRSGWGIGGVGNSFGDLEILSITPVSFPNAATMTQNLDVADILAASTQTDVYFNIYNDCTLDSVVLFEPN